VAGRRLPPAPSLGRRAETRDLLDSLVVVCEGQTEKAVLDHLKATWRISSVRILGIVGGMGAPSQVLRRGEKELERGAAKGKPTLWLVFDRDTHSCWDSTIIAAERAGHRLATSNPCFELWAILLHADQTASLDSAAAQRRLRDLHPHYHHDKHPHLDGKTVVECLEAVPARVRNLAQRAEGVGSGPRCNPSTSFHDLVEALRSMAEAPTREAPSNRSPSARPRRT
jgi:hypothetical protein